MLYFNFTFLLQLLIDSWNSNQTCDNRDGDLALFNSLLESADVNHVSESLHGIKFVFNTLATMQGPIFWQHVAGRYTPLGIAIVFNHQEIALRLLDHPDIDVNKKTCESTALHYAALRNNVVLLEAICSKSEVQVICSLFYI